VCEAVEHLAQRGDGHSSPVRDLGVCAVGAPGAGLVVRLVDEIGEHDQHVPLRHRQPGWGVVEHLCDQLPCHVRSPGPAGRGAGVEQPAGQAAALVDGQRGIGVQRPVDVSAEDVLAQLAVCVEQLGVVGGTVARQRGDTGAAV
jgi:hypothetical protein